MFADMGQVRRRELTLVVAAVAAAGAITGCGGDKGDDAAPSAAKPTATTPGAPAATTPAPESVGTPSSGDAIARAATVAAAQKGGLKLALRGKIAANGQDITVRGTGSVDRSKGRGAFTVISNMGAADLAIREVLADGQLYMTSKLFTDKLPGKRSWLRIDLDKAKDVKGFDPNALGTNGPSYDPSQVLDYLHGAGPAKRLGTATIRGTKTTHYRADVDLQRALKETKGQAARASIESLLPLLGKQKTIPVEVWLDSRHRVLRERVSYKANLRGVENAMDFTTDFTSFDAAVSADRPPASDTVDALKLLTQNQPQG